MSEHENHEPPAKYSYAVGAGLGVLIGGAVGLLAGASGVSFLIDAVLGVAIGLIVTYLVKFLRP